MFRYYQFYLIYLLALMILSCDKTDQHLFIEGCMYENACNYNPEATANDDSCLYNDCIGVCGGDAVFDECDICDGNNSTCSDCDGVPNGESYLDCCGNCDMNSTNDCLLIQDLCIYDVEISVCGLEYLGLNEAIFTICADSPEYHISGFQFAFNASNFNISEVTLGEDAELANMVNYAESDLFALAVSYPMSYIPSGSNLELVLFKGTYTNNEGLVQIIPTPGDNGSITIGSSNAEELSILINNINWSEISGN